MAASEIMPLREIPLCPLPEELTVADQTLFGVPVQHSWTSLYVLERVLAASPWIERIVEIGTGGGGLTLFFGVQSALRGLTALSIDSVDRVPPRAAAMLDRLPVSRVIGSYADPNVMLIVGAALSRPAMVYCDNGNKVLELRTYAPLLKPGDLILSHDYGVEFSPRDVEDLAPTCRLVPYHQHLFDGARAAIVAYRKVESVR